MAIKFKANIQLEQERKILDNSANTILSSNGGSIIEITWNELRLLRDNSKLVPGAWYKITDYVCTAVDWRQSADARYKASGAHPFDIIIQAISSNTLNENAFASKKSGDTYFSYDNLAAWELKYCLDNDISRFGWAQVYYKEYAVIGTTATTGNKVWRCPILELYCPEGYSHAWLTQNNYYKASYQLDVYFTKTEDEQYQDTESTTFIPDFIPAKKTTILNGILGTTFTDTTISKIYDAYLSYQDGVSAETLVKPTVPADGKGVIYYMKDEFNNEAGYDFKNILIRGHTNSNYYYTFDTKNTVDASKAERALMNYGNEWKTVAKAANNKIAPHTDGVYGSTGANGALDIPCIIVYGNSNISRWEGAAINNIFGPNCENIELGPFAYDNIFEGNINSLYLGSNILNNHFGTNINSLKFATATGSNGEVLNYIRCCYIASGTARLTIKSTQAMSTTDGWVEDVVIYPGIRNGYIYSKTVTITRTSSSTKTHGLIEVKPTDSTVINVTPQEN